MALIKCPDCGTEMSDRAAACLKCGAPISIARTDATVTEQTGKGHKSAQAIGAIACCAGIVFIIGGAPAFGSLLLMGGLVIFIGARLTAWWSHG